MRGGEEERHGVGWREGVWRDVDATGAVTVGVIRGGGTRGRPCASVVRGVRSSYIARPWRSRRLGTAGLSLGGVFPRDQLRIVWFASCRCGRPKRAATRCILTLSLRFC